MSARASSSVVSRSSAGDLSVAHCDLACGAHHSPEGRVPAPRPGPREFHIALDDLDDICAVANIVDRLPGHEGQSSIRRTGRRAGLAHGGPESSRNKSIAVQNGNATNVLTRASPY